MAEKVSSAVRNGKPGFLRVTGTLIYFDGEPIGEILYDREDTKYYVVTIRKLDGKTAYASDLVRKNGIARALVDAGIPCADYPVKKNKEVLADES